MDNERFPNGWQHGHAKDRLYDGWCGTLLELFLWENDKDRCYSNDPQTIDALEQNIQQAIYEIEI